MASCSTASSRSFAFSLPILSSTRRIACCRPLTRARMANRIAEITARGQCLAVQIANIDEPEFELHGRGIDRVSHPNGFFSKVKSHLFDRFAEFHQARE